jgi:hypothetical protein
MRELEQFADPEMIPCKMCKEIPISEGSKRGGGRLRTAFCGLECYAMEIPGRGAG